MGAIPDRTGELANTHLFGGSGEALQVTIHLVVEVC